MATNPTTETDNSSVMEIITQIQDIETKMLVAMTIHAMVKYQLKDAIEFIRKFFLEVAGLEKDLNKLDNVPTESSRFVTSVTEFLIVVWVLLPQMIAF